jgi:phage shock protein C
MPNEKPKRVYRSANDKILGGVCGGIADYYNVDPVLVRLLWIAISFLWGLGILLYIIAWIIIPRNPKQK